MRASGQALPPVDEPLAPLSVAGRIDRVRAALAGVVSDEGRPDGLLVSDPANIRWLTGFTGSAGVLLVTGERALLTSDGRYRTQADEQLAASGVAGEVGVSIGGVSTQRDALAEAAGDAEVLGLEAAHVSWAALQSWESVFAPRLLVEADPQQLHLHSLDVSRLRRRYGAQQPAR